MGFFHLGFLELFVQNGTFHQKHTRIASTQDLACHITQVLRLMWCECCRVCLGGCSQSEDGILILLQSRNKLITNNKMLKSFFLFSSLDMILCTSCQTQKRRHFSMDTVIMTRPEDIFFYSGRSTNHPNAICKHHHFPIVHQHSPNRLSIRARSGPQWNSEKSRWDNIQHFCRSFCKMKNACCVMFLSW